MRPGGESPEVPLLLAVQGALAGRPGVLPAARGLSHFGEHALGWMAVSAAGAVTDPARREEWTAVGVGAVTAHAASIAIKRVVRRPRPDDPRVRVGVSTPSRLSFPSSHATSSTAAALLIARASRRRAALGIIPVMALSRLVLGVHYPSDVAAGAGIGAATAAVVTRLRPRIPGVRGTAGHRLSEDPADPREANPGAGGQA